VPIQAPNSCHTCGQGLTAFRSSEMTRWVKNRPGPTHSLDIKARADVDNLEYQFNVAGSTLER
jgi:hypothetical protein